VAAILTCSKDVRHGTSPLASAGIASVLVAIAAQKKALLFIRGIVFEGRRVGNI
jgi:hypothetical protein